MFYTNMYMCILVASFKAILQSSDCTPLHPQMIALILMILLQNLCCRNTHHVEITKFVQEIQSWLLTTSAVSIYEPLIAYHFQAGWRKPHSPSNFCTAGKHGKWTDRSKNEKSIMDREKTENKLIFKELYYIRCGILPKKGGLHRSLVPRNRRKTEN